MPSYKQAYEKAGGAAKLGDYGSWEKKAKAWNQKKYGTTEPTATAKKQGISKESLAKQNSSNIRMESTVTKALDPDHKITFGPKSQVDNGVVKRSHIVSSSEVVKPKAPEGMQKVGGTYQPTPDLSNRSKRKAKRAARKSQKDDKKFAKRASKSMKKYGTNSSSKDANLGLAMKKINSSVDKFL